MTAFLSPTLPFKILAPFPKSIQNPTNTCIIPRQPKSTTFSKLQHPPPTDTTTKTTLQPTKQQQHFQISLPSPLPTLSLLTLLSLPILSSHTFQHAFSTFITGPHLPIIAAIFFSALIQSLTGFGFAIISVAALTNLPWIANSSLLQSIQPIAATLGAITTYILLIPEIPSIKWSSLKPLLISSTFLTPLGIILSNTESTILLKLLGTIITTYVIYTTTGIKLPKFLASTQGAYLLGGIAGIFGGMFDITGPALVIYGDAKGWAQDFRTNVLTVISFNSTVVVIADSFTGRLQDFYYWDFVTWAFPSVIAGILLGKFLARRLDPHAFKRLVLGTCFFVGLKMMIF